MSQLAVHCREVAISMVVAGLFGVSAAIPAACAATAIGHASVTILPTASMVAATPIELGGKSDADIESIRRGLITVTGAPNEAITISVRANGPATGRGPALLIGSVDDNAGPSPALGAAGRLVVAVDARAQAGAGNREGAYAGTYSVIVNY